MPLDEWDDHDDHRALQLVSSIRQELINILRAQIATQRQQLSLKDEQMQLEEDRMNDAINEGLYIRRSRELVLNWNTYREEIHDYAREAAHQEENMHVMLDLCERRGIYYKIPLYDEQTRTMIRLRAIIDSNTDKGCT